MTDQPTYPDVTVQLVGEDGNAMAIIARISLALRRAGHAQAASDFVTDAMNQFSYDGVLQLAMRTVNVT